MTDHQILQTFADKLVTQLQAATPKVTGKTAQAITATVSEEGTLQVEGPEYIQALITGRGPSKGKGGSLYSGILQWVKAKGLIPKEQKMTQESLAYVITRKIHQEGSLLYRKGGNKDSQLAKLLHTPNINPLIDQLTEYYTQEFTDLLIN